MEITAKQKINKSQQCPLVNWCPNLTATCRVNLPDEECYWYRWFKNLIKENENKEDRSIKNWAGCSAKKCPYGKEYGECESCEYLILKWEINEK